MYKQTLKDELADVISYKQSPDCSQSTEGLNMHGANHDPTWLRGYKIFSCSTQLNMKFQLHVHKFILLNIKIFLAFKLLDAVFTC